MGVKKMRNIINRIKNFFGAIPKTIRSKLLVSSTNQGKFLKKRTRMAVSMKNSSKEQKKNVPKPEIKSAPKTIKDEILEEIKPDERLSSKEVQHILNPKKTE